MNIGDVLVNVGDKVWVVSIRRHHTAAGDGQYRAVTKVGRKYFEVEGLVKARFYLEDGLHENGEYPAWYAAYPSEDAYLLHLNAKAELARCVDIAKIVREALYSLYCSNRQPPYTLAQLEQVATILCLKLPEPGDTDG